MGEVFVSQKKKCNNNNDFFKYQLFQNKRSLICGGNGIFLYWDRDIFYVKVLLKNYNFKCNKRTRIIVNPKWMYAA